MLGPAVSTPIDVPFPDALDEPSDDSLTAISDPAVLDPLDELERRDIVSLLDRALGLLSAESRQVTELCYLAEIPQRIVAAQSWHHTQRSGGTTVSSSEAPSAVAV